jgi:hypothetical protein
MVALKPSNPLSLPQMQKRVLEQAKNDQDEIKPKHPHHMGNTQEWVRYKNRRCMPLWLVNDYTR